ncbi:FimD/PapC C-terminal domain-containing protein [Leclercia sp. LTM14]|nr:FimD/PapC C-terminal domain-containing protein [Leclercia sp. LTM14]
MPDNAEIEIATTSVIPSRGSITRAEFSANVGLRAFLTLNDSSGKSIPFGATVSYLSTVNGQSSNGIVSDGGQVYMSGLDESGTLDVQWGRNNHQKCKAQYQLKSNSAVNGITQANSICR